MNAFVFYRQILVRCWPFKCIISKEHVRHFFIYSVFVEEIATPHKPNNRENHFVFRKRLTLINMFSISLQCRVQIWLSKNWGYLFARVKHIKFLISTQSRIYISTVSTHTDLATFLSIRQKNNVRTVFRQNQNVNPCARYHPFLFIIIRLYPRHAVCCFLRLIQR